MTQKRSKSEIQEEIDELEDELSGLMGELGVDCSSALPTEAILSGYELYWSESAHEMTLYKNEDESVYVWNYIPNIVEVDEVYKKIKEVDAS